MTSSTTTAPSSRGAFSMDMALKTVGGILLAIISWLCTHMLGQIAELAQVQSQHAERVRAVEVRSDGTKQLLIDIRTDLKEIRQELRNR